MADGDENAFHLQIGKCAGFDVLKFDGFYFAFLIGYVASCVPDRCDLASLRARWTMILVACNVSRRWIGNTSEAERMRKITRSRPAVLPAPDIAKPGLGG